jgi:DNA polymerase III epsilon subunit family exonuclease
MTNFVKIIAFDLETTGLDAVKDEIIEIGAILFTVKESRGRMGPEKIEEFQTFIKASKPISAEASQTNKITDEMLLGAPSCTEALQKFKIFCDKSDCLVAHNAEAFDKKFLSMAYGKHSVLAPTQHILDSIKMARNIIQLPNYSLGAIAKYFEARNEISLKITEDAMHRAVYDCEMLMHILVALLQGRLSNEEWTAQEFLQALKRKDFHQDSSPIKPVKPKPAGLF